ncbi:MAG: hypothetical protein GY830_02390 [Bacteroidetes bacterium]|nr:hypothetical protein [Bacteroidota bacterium]
MVHNIIALFIFFNFVYCKGIQEKSNFNMRNKRLNPVQVSYISKCNSFKCLVGSCIGLLLSNYFLQHNLNKFSTYQIVYNNDFENKIYNPNVLCRDLPNFYEYLHTLDKKRNRLTIEAIEANNTNIYTSINYIEEYIENLVPYLTCLPEEINKKNIPPINIDDIDCLDPNLNNLFKGKRKKPVYFLDMFGFGYELGVLEMRLYELDGIIDQFILFESIYGHKMIKKPLFYEMTKNIRFKQFKDKIYHLILDDELFYLDYIKETEILDQDWRGEHIMRTYPWDKFLKTTKNMNLTFFLGEEKALMYDNNTILLISGDLDEIPNRKSLAYFKYCEPNKFKYPIKIDDDIKYRLNFDYLWEIGTCSKIYNVGSSGNEYKFKKKQTFKTERHVFKIKTKNRTIFKYHINRGVNDFQMAIKAIIQAEAKYGIKPEAPTSFFHFRYENKPLLACRQCTENREECSKKKCDQKYIPRKKTDPIPWFAVCNKQRFPYLFPMSCKHENIDKYPLRFVCSNTKTCSYNGSTNNL